MRQWMVGALLAGFAVTAAAQNDKSYVGVNLGASKYSDICDGIPPNFTCDDSGFAGKVYGGYYVVPFFGVEISYNNFGQGSVPAFIVNPPPGTVALQSQGDVKTYAFVLSLVGRVPIGPVSLIGRAGYGAVTGRLTGNAAVQDITTGAITHYDASSRETTGQFFYGVALSVDFARSWSARLDWDRTKAEDGRNPDYTVDMLTAGVAYRF
jgi:hypothetical protein